jgi:uncharacterized membrane protein YccC
MAGWVRAKDPGFLAVKRSVRAAIVMPLVFGLTHLLFPNSPQTGIVGAFGSFALLLLANFQGRPRTRLVTYLALFLVGSCLIALGTVTSTQKEAAVVAMAVVAFAVLFTGIVSPLAASASTATLLTFVVAVAVVQPAASVGSRLVGWALAGALCIPACMLIWPPPWQDNLRRRLSATVSAVAKLASARAQGEPSPEAEAAVTAELSRLRGQFGVTPYPPAGAAAGAVALATLMGRVEWLASNSAQIGDETAVFKLSPVQAVMEQTAETLRLSAALICDGKGYPVDDRQLVRTVQESTKRLEGLLGTELDAEVSTLIDTDTHGTGQGLDPRAPLASLLDPTFVGRALARAAEMVADAALEAAGARPVGDRRRGPVDQAPSRLPWQQLRSYLSFRSVWFRNAVRGAAGLTLAVAVVEVTNVEHGFWVVLGTLSVLRSNALGTGSTALRAVGGTLVGFGVGAAIMIGVASHLVLLWVLLPFAVLVAGAAPSMISFAAGQAGFTVVVIILFNIIVPTGWTVGLTRIEDVAIGAAVSVVVGLLFWPRGATAALGRALSDAYVESSEYLADAVDRLTTRTREVNTGPDRRAADSAYLRLDDAFREFLAERGAKTVTVETVARLFTGTNWLRLAAYTLASAPALDPDQPELESVAIAGAVLRDSYASSHRWYEEFAEMLAGRRNSLDPPPVHGKTLHDAVRKAFEDARARRRGDQLRATLQMLWADEVLEAQGQVQADLARSANLFARRTRQAHMI